VRSCIAVLLLCFFCAASGAEDCIASVYSIGDRSQRGTRTASGIPLDDNAMTAATEPLSLVPR
jgi:rare lipoprotein A (peptidoglycan hydrolase)